MPSGHVLVVDDDRDIRETVVEILQDSGYQVRTASDGDEALEKMRVERPALVLLDLNMPRMGGEEVRRAQRADPALATIPTVIVSAADRLSERVAELVPEGFLTKPVNLRVLLATVAKFCASG